MSSYNSYLHKFVKRNDHSESSDSKGSSSPSFQSAAYIKFLEDQLTKSQESLTNLDAMNIKIETLQDHVFALEEKLFATNELIKLTEQCTREREDENESVKQKCKQFLNFFEQDKQEFKKSEFERRIIQIENEMKDFLQRAATTQSFFNEEIKKGASIILREYEESLKEVTKNVVQSESKRINEFQTRVENFMESFSKDVAYDLKGLEKKVKECSLITARIAEDYMGPEAKQGIETLIKAKDEIEAERKRDIEQIKSEMKDELGALRKACRVSNKKIDFLLENAQQKSKNLTNVFSSERKELPSARMKESLTSNFLESKDILRSPRQDKNRLKSKSSPKRKQGKTSEKKLDEIKKILGEQIVLQKDFQKKLALVENRTPVPREKSLLPFNKKRNINYSFTKNNDPYNSKEDDMRRSLINIMSPTSMKSTKKRSLFDNEVVSSFNTNKGKKKEKGEPIDILKLARIIKENNIKTDNKKLLLLSRSSTSQMEEEEEN